ncbi:uroporphyrinogen-III synthase [Enterococcus rotai]|uniref:uroporphyrinogen-III synthase n=1 Tax=Enterococcus rotai TaxID=118060 RepID=UPI0035C73426
MNTILLTRLVEDNAEDRSYFQTRGFETVEIPLIELKKRALDQSFEIMVKQSEWIFLTSQHAAAFFFQQISQKEIEMKKFAVIGEKTAQVLFANQIETTFQAPQATKKNLFETWSSCYVEPTTIFYPKSNLADKAGEAELITKGHQLFTPILYDNCFPKEHQLLLQNCLTAKKITAVYLASPSLWERFLSVFREVDLSEMPTLYCLGETTRQAILKDGYEAMLRKEV